MTRESSNALEACSDEQLVSSTRQGSNEAFEALILRYRRRVTGVALRFFSNIDDAEDLAQDAFVRAYTNLEKLKPGVPFESWVLRITVNLCIDRLRRRRRRKEEVVSHITPEENSWLNRQLRSATLEEPAEMEQSFEARALLDRILPHIAPKDRAVLHLMYAEDRSVAEVAQILGWSKANVRVRAFRAKHTLRQVLQELLARTKE
jgi:RNA polymerase sigma-70 factor (ECF subfamily)